MRAVRLDEPRVVLPIEAEVLQHKVRPLPSQPPDDVSVFAGDEIDGVCESRGEEIVPIGVLVD